MNVEQYTDIQNENPKDGGGHCNKKQKRQNSKSMEDASACTVNSGGNFEYEDKEKFYRCIYVNGWPEYILKKSSCFRKYIIHHNQKPTLLNQIVAILAATAVGLLIIGILFFSYYVSNKYSFGRVIVISILILTYVIFLKLSDNKIEDPLFRILEGGIITALLSNRFN